MPYLDPPRDLVDKSDLATGVYTAQFLIIILYVCLQTILSLSIYYIVQLPNNIINIISAPGDMSARHEVQDTDLHVRNEDHGNDLTERDEDHGNCFPGRDEDHGNDLPRRDEGHGNDLPGRDDEYHATDLPTGMIVIDNFK
jgi:hypothetical protein